jgi:hypothetical protein
MTTRAEYVEALRTERRYAETIPVDQGREQRLADIDAELQRFEPAPQAKARGRGPEVG